ncbi:MAG: sugar-binding transcriptional regulator [Pseudonocardiaceae bacterium]|nr:sugar-binding transcriptional regulator [Pseudonocardiaceae bacterium]
MPPPRDQDLLVRAARLYYQENRSQQEIANALEVSRSNVSRMLAAARDRGIVEVRINDPTGRELELERELTEAYGLRDCRVADTHGGEQLLPRVGDLGGRWVQENLRSGQRIGVSWGRTLQAVVQHVPDFGGLDIEVVPLVGGLSSVDSEITGEELVRDLAGRLGGRFQRLHAPALLTSDTGRDVLLAEPTIASALAAAREVSVALVGIGSFGTGSSAAIVDALNLSDTERARFDATKPAGDVCARFFDSSGAAITGPVNDRVLAISLADLARIPMVVGVAAGPEKSRGVLGVLRSKAVDVLICDSSLARALISGRESR